MRMKLSYKHRRAIAGLLTLDTIAQAAENAGVTERTVYNWLNNADFRQALAEAEAQAVAEAARQMAAGAKKAVAALVEVIDDPEATNRERIAAASSFLAHLPQVRLLGSIEERLARAERGDTE